MTLTKTGFIGAAWIGALKVVIKIFSLLKLVVVARILSPQEVGWYGIVLLPYGLAEVMTESGLNQALIQSRKEIKGYLSSAWLAFIIRGIGIAGFLFFLAPWVSRYYQTDLTLAIRLISLTPLIKGLMNPAIVLFRKNLEFKKEFMFQSLASIAESLGTILLVWQTRSWLALPLGTIVGGTAALLFSFVFIKFSFSRFSLAKVKELYRYGRWVTLGTLVSYLTDNGDNFVVSRVAGAYPLGLYQTAYNISNLTTTQGAGLIYQVVFPMFAKIQTDKVRLKRGLIKSLAIAFSLSFLFCAFVYLFAPLLIGLFFGVKWLAMVPALNILLIFSLTRPLYSVGSAVFDAIGVPKIIAVINLIKLIVLAILLFPLTKAYGLVGTAWAVVISQLIIYPLFLIKLKKTLSVTPNLVRS